MKVFIVFDGEYEQWGPEEAFATKELAEAYLSQLDLGGEILEFPLHETLPPIWTYYHRGASVFPDKTFDEWSQTHHARGIPNIPPCDDHLNSRVEPWDGHTHQHCGEHVSIFGTDKDLVETAFQKHLANALARQTGICPSCNGKPGKYIQTTARNYART